MGSSTLNEHVSSRARTRFIHLFIRLRHRPQYAYRTKPVAKANVYECFLSDPGMLSASAGVSSWKPPHKAMGYAHNPSRRPKSHPLEHRVLVLLHLRAWAAFGPPALPAAGLHTAPMPSSSQQTFSLPELFEKLLYYSSWAGQKITHTPRVQEIEIPLYPHSEILSES